jgi:tetratricopeptide (TPR) repeat protein
VRRCPWPLWGVAAHGKAPLTSHTLDTAAESRAHAAKRPLGISLAGFGALIAAHGGREALAGKSTDWLKTNVVLPATAATESSYLAQLLVGESPHVREATAFVSHWYGEEFLLVVDAIAAWEGKDATRAGTFYYFDLLTVNQHGQDAVVPFETLRHEFGESVRAIGRTLLVLRWANPVPLTRAWCVFEMGTTLAVEAPLEVIMPPGDAAAFLEALQTDFDSLTAKTCTVDVEHATAHVPADLENIQRVIRETGGYLRTNQLVIGAMNEWMVGEARRTLAAMGAEERAASVLPNNLARLLEAQGKLSEAEPLYREALEHCRVTLDHQHPETLAAKNNLGNLLNKLGRLDEAEPLLSAALEARETTLGSEHPDTLVSMNNVAILLKAKGDLEGAVALYREALDVRRRAQGEGHLDTLAATNNLGIALKGEGKLEEAEALCRMALEGRRRLLPADHPDVLGSALNLAAVLEKQGQLGQAEVLCREAVGGFRRTLGDTHHCTLGVIGNLALVLKAQGELEEAEAHLLEALHGQRKTLGEEHLDTLNTEYNLGELREAQGRGEEARALYEREVEASRRTLGKAHPRTVSSQKNLERLSLSSGGGGSQGGGFYPGSPGLRRGTQGSSPGQAGGGGDSAGRALQF